MDGHVRAGRAVPDPGGPVSASRSSEILSEQEVVDRLYARLDALRAQTRGRLAKVRRSGPSGSPQNRSERDAFATLYEDRIAQLEAVEDRLCFGRLDLTDGEVRHIGRIGLTDDEHSSILTDWRAPAAQAFYRATAVHPDGVLRRRHLVTRARQVVSLEDEVLDLDALGDEQVHLSGEGALFAAMAAQRTGRMNDIVATIQAEQDRIIRSDLAGALVVQGGPGTGKTAVALHRAAYLLYAHRRVLERSGVLLVGPSSAFLRYIDQVLPSLGETGVVATTMGDLLPGVSARAEEPTDLAARLKGDASMARVVARAVRARQRIPEHDVPFRLEGVDLVLRRDDVREAAARARRTNKPHNVARVTFVKEMLSRLATQYGRATGVELEQEDRRMVLDDLRAHRDVRVTLNLAWFPLTPQRLVEDLWAKPHRLAEAAPHLSDAQRAALAREPGSPWTVSDIPLLDEAAELLGEDDQAERAQAKADAAARARDLEYAQEVLKGTGAGALVSAEVLADRFAAGGTSLTTAERAAADRTWTYGHVVVDEAQELTAMAWRSLLRRVPTRSLTIVGDVAQTSAAGGARSWRTMLDAPLRGAWRLEELTVNYRTPAVVADAARSAALAADLPVSPMTSAREVDDALHVHWSRDVAREAARVVATEVRSGTTADGVGRIAVVAEPRRTASLRAALRDVLPDASLRAVRGDDELDAPVSVVDPRTVKGLEYDVVVLVEPDELAPSDLYVAMTRPTQRLHLVHSHDLPARIAEAVAAP
ncbi:AAA family ATPase [Flavimobilis sp. GY10621]|uniref:AAA family ATPase n=1 Tax=Flavimobilis rhizosphaerae TaxID=2775421 RepID=A0ABR9DRG2_9MICO|nr:AAA family ATPase [Flavimobilis rhizosphaerae]